MYPAADNEKKNAEFVIKENELNMDQGLKVIERDEETILNFNKIKEFNDAYEIEKRRLKKPTKSL